MANQTDLPAPGRARRGFLKKGVFGGALLAIGGLGFLASRSSKKAPSPPEPLVTFDEYEYAVVYAIAARLIPARPGFPSIDEVKVAANADRVLARADVGARKEVKQLVRLFENGLTNFLFAGQTEPFT